MNESDIAADKAAVLEGFHLIDKPSGITSHRLLSSIKKTVASRGKIGHAGTLDSFASGMLIVLLGRYTRLSDYFMSAGKGYDALLRFGEETDTLDPEGTVVATAPLPRLEDLEAVLPSFTGEILQAPPAYSAVHINGQRAYELALRGEAVEPEARPVSIQRLDLLSYGNGEARLRIACSKGTYIRSLARDIALACGSRAHLRELRRTFSGPFTLEDAMAPEEAVRCLPRKLGVKDALGLGLEVLTLSGPEAPLFARGMPLHRMDAFQGNAAKRPLAVFNERGILMGIALRDGKRWSYGMVFEGSA